MPDYHHDDTSSDVSEMNLEDFTSSDTAEVLHVVDAYNKWWDHIRFRKSWTTPPFEQSAVAPFLRTAAELVVRIRKHLDEADTGFKLRMPAGAAHEFFWTVDYDPVKNSKEFIRGLVHATFQDGNGYVEGLTASVLDDYVKEIEDYWKGLPHYHHRNPDHNLARSYNNWKQEITELLNDNFDLLGQVANSEAVFPSSELLTVCQLLQRCKDSLTSVVATQESTPAMPKEPFAFEDQARESQQAEDAMYHTQLDTNAAPQGEQGTNEQAAADQAATDSAIQQPESDFSDAEARVKSPLTAPSTLEEEPVNSSNELTSPVTPSSGQIIVKRNKKRAPKRRAAAKRAREELELAQPAQQAAADAAPQTPQTPQTPLTEDEATKAEKRKFSIEITKVQEDISAKKSELQHLLEDCENVKLDDLDAMHAEQLIGKLQKRALFSSEYLMRDMLTLDQLTCANPEQRSQRKQQVVAIQDILSALDEVSQKLAALQQITKERREEEDKVRAEEDAKRQAEEAEQQRQKAQKMEAETSKHRSHAGQRAQDKRSQLIQMFSEAVNSADCWSQCKLSTQFQVQERIDAYIVTSLIKGMDSKDVSIALNDDDTQLFVTGKKLPTTGEVTALREQVSAAIQAGRFDSYQVPATPQALLDSLTSGRYGSFQQSYQLPSDADPAGVEGSYENGVLKVVIPRVRQTRNSRFSPMFDSMDDAWESNYPRSRRSVRDPFWRF